MKDKPITPLILLLMLIAIVTTFLLQRSHPTLASQSDTNNDIAPVNRPALTILQSANEQLNFLPLLLAAEGSSPIPGNGLVLHYPFDGNANDATGRGNDGSEYGGVTYVAGKIGQAARFDGRNDFIRKDNPPILQELDAVFTVSFWIMPEGNQNSGVIDIAQENRETWEIYHRNQQVGFAQNWRRPESEEFPQSEVFPHTASTPLNIWTHVALVYQNQQLVVYQNGTKLAEGGFSTNPIIDGSEWIEVGLNAAGGDEYFKGQIDEIRIYNRALTDSEIQLLYEQNVNQ